MKTKILLSLLLAFTGFGLQLKAQQITSGNPGMWPSIIQYGTAAPAFNQSAIKMIDLSGLTATVSNSKLQQVAKDERGTNHYRYEQKLNGIPVENAILNVHVAKGKIQSQNGKFIKDFPAGLTASASVTATAALELAKKNIGASQYKWEIPGEEALLKRDHPSASYIPKGTLVYYSGEQDVIPSALRLAWKFDIYAQEPLSRQIIFVDAGNGKILGKRELIHETNAPGTAITAYSGSKPILADNTGSNYRLRETGRGNGINTYDLQRSSNYAGAIDFTDADNTWNNVNANKDQYATDAHWGTEMTYDYFFTKFNRNSIDNAGFALNSYLHYSTNYFNAFWDGYKMTYGDGDATDGYKPLTSLDVCGHEITHGLTANTSNLNYSYESGAMNEGFSDIFGTAIEAFARPTNTDWLIGGDFYTIRSMSNPNAYSQPDTYQGTFWYTSSSDNGGVHTNSGVLNYWFYLLTAGGSGTNDHGAAFNVTGIGIDKAAAIAYKLNTFYLVSTSDYYDARILGIQAAEQLYGIGSNEAIQTANAWTAVGLYAPTCAATSGLNTSSILDLQATLNWDNIVGATSYTIQYKENAGSSWYTATTTNNSYVLQNLSPSTLYAWKVKANCNGTFSNAQFTTLAPICHPPVELTFMVNGTTVVLDWAYGIFAQSYVLEYKPNSANSWTRLPVLTATTTTLSGLNNTTLYDWRVRSTCSADTSDWVNSQFTTDVALCPAPAGLATDFAPGLVTKNHWNPVPGAINYRLQYKRLYSQWSDGESGTIILTDTSFTNAGFMSGMTIDWRVKTFCGNNYSDYALSQYTTPIPAPVNLTISGITPSTATMTWANGGANSPFGYTVSYKLSTASTWSTYSPTGSTSLTLTGLQPGKLYNCRVRQNGADVNSLYTQTQFTTLCPAIPANLNYSKVTTNSARVSWGAVSGASTYKLYYRPSYSGSFNTVSGITTPYYDLAGLQANTTYYYKVESICTSGGTGPGAEYSFITYCISSGVNSQEWIDYFKFGTLERYSGADAGGYFNSASTYSAAPFTIGSTGNAGIVSAGYSGAVKNEYYAVYIDLNRNGSFADAGERVAGQTAMTNAGNYNFTVNIPLTATAGVTTMRVVMQRQPNAVSYCNTGIRGETEDYLITLVTPSALMPLSTPVFTEAASNTGSNITVGPNPSNGRYTISIKDDFLPVTFKVINSNGTMVNNGNVHSAKQFSVDITALPSGFYLLRLSDSEGKSETVKLMKN